MYYMSAVSEAQGQGYCRMLMIGSFVDDYSASIAFQKVFNCLEFPSYYEREEFLEEFGVFIPQVIRNALDPDYHKIYGEGFTFALSFRV